VVGVQLAFYADRVIDGRPRRFCNVAAWCVAPAHRAHGVRLLASLLAQKGYTFTDLSPSGNVVPLNRRLNFQMLDTASSLVVNWPWPRTGGVRILSDRAQIEARLDGRDLEIFRDHQRACAAHHLVVTSGSESCYVVFRRERRKRLRLFATLLHVGNPALLRRTLRPLCGHLLTHFGIAATFVEHRVAGFRPAHAIAAQPRVCACSAAAISAPGRSTISTANWSAFRGERWPMQRHIKTNLCHLIEISAQRQPGAPAVTFRGEQVGYEELWRQVRAFAGGLVALGLRRNDRVAIFLEKRIETVVAIFGTMAAGCVAVPANPLLKPAQVAYIMRDCAVRALVTSPERLAQMRDEIGQCPAMEHVVCVGAAQSASMAGAALHGWEGFGASLPVRCRTRTRWTRHGRHPLHAGSTGRPKGVVLSHRNMIVGAESVSAYLENGPADTILSVLPLSFEPASASSPRPSTLAPMSC